MCSCGIGLFMNEFLAKIGLVIHIFVNVWTLLRLA